MVDKIKWISVKNILGYEVRIGDINYGGHMGNDKSLLLFHDARIAFLEFLGFSEKDIGEDKGIIMSEAHVYFKKELFLHDRLTVDIQVEEVTTSSFTLNYEVRYLHDGTEVMHGATRLIAYDYERRKVSRLPDVFLDKIREGS
jgi:acyl-CoA thioester hydrolase